MEGTSLSSLNRSIIDCTMATFDFDDAVQESTFKGEVFYEAHKNDIFLSECKNLENILCQGKKLREKLKTIQPGNYLEINGLMVRENEALQIQKGGPGITISDVQYTLNRLTGMCAAYCVKHNVNPRPKCAMSISLGLSDVDKKLYYSAAPGAEHFTQVFSYFPLLCAVQQLRQGKVSKESIARIAAVKTSSGITLGTLLENDKAHITEHVKKFGKGGTKSVVELEKAISVFKSLGLF